MRLYHSITMIVFCLGWLTSILGRPEFLFLDEGQEPPQKAPTSSLYLRQMRRRKYLIISYYENLMQLERPGAGLSCFDSCGSHLQYQ